jgi:hypothetical protein
MSVYELPLSDSLSLLLAHGSSSATVLGHLSGLILLAWKRKPRGLQLDVVGPSFFFTKEPLDIRVIVALELLEHDCHHSDVVVVYQVDFPKIEGLRQLPLIISEEKVRHCLELGRSLAILHMGLTAL